MQDDPDPDAIASALALKTLLGRNRTSAPICTFGSITRPENVAMCRILDIEVEEISAQALDQFDRVAMVDVQPSFLEERFDQIDLVIDHHPVEHPIRAKIRDVRPSYGATSTILVEYLRAVDIKISQRLATALLYGIKADTLGLERGGSRADLEAFMFLYMLANHNALRRIERPELSDTALDVLAHGLARRQIVRNVFFSHLGHMGTPDQIPQFADFGLQAEGVSGRWSRAWSTIWSTSPAQCRLRQERGRGDARRLRRPRVGGRPPHDGQGRHPSRQPARRALPEETSSANRGARRVSRIKAADESRSCPHCPALARLANGSARCGPSAERASCAVPGPNGKRLRPLGRLAWSV